MAINQKEHDLQLGHDYTMNRFRSRSPMSPCRSSSPYLTTTSRRSSPYPTTPGLAPHWYFDELMHDCPFHIATCKGCDGTSTEYHYEDGADRQSVYSSWSSYGEDARSRGSMTPASSIRSFNSPEATRMQLKEEFLRLYFPAGISDHETDFMYSKFLARDSLQSLSQTMHAAVDTLGLIQLGTSHSDSRLIQEAQRRYQTAVAALHQDLERPNAMYDDGVLGAIYLLGFCEMYRPLSQNESPLRTHHRGLQDLLLARGPKGEYSKFAQLLVYNVRHLATIIGFTERKNVAFSGKEWGQCSAMTDRMTAALSEQIISIPGMLEKADRAMSRSKRDSNQLFAILTELANLERNMQKWLFNWYKSFEHQPYWQINVETFGHFRQHSRNTGVFQKALRFPSFSHCSEQATYWIGLLQIKQTMFEINRLYHKPVLPKLEATLVAEANECASKLCESVAWISQPRYGFCGVIRAMGPLQYAFKWYSTQMNLEKMAWCDRVRKSLETSTSMTTLFVGASSSQQSEHQEPTPGIEEDDADFQIDNTESIVSTP